MNSKKYELIISEQRKETTQDVIGCDAHALWERSRTHPITSAGY